jgi:periplasmic divalent cation tolerance protein
MADESLIALCTFPNAETARKVAREIIELRLAACANVLPQVHSIYWWKGEVETGDETLVIFKLPASQYDSFETKLRALHPYEVPEIISCKIERGLPDYLQWVAESCRPQT